MTCYDVQKDSVMQTRTEALYRLSRSKFRSSFHLNEQDRKYVREKGMDTIVHTLMTLCGRVWHRHGRTTTGNKHP